MTVLHLVRTADNERIALPFPVSHSQIKKVLGQRTESTDISTIQLTQVTGSIAGINGYLQTVDIRSEGELNKLNALADKIAQMDCDAAQKFEGILDANSVNGLDEVLRLTSILDEYITLRHADTDSALGRYLVENSVKYFPEYVRPYLDYRRIGIEFDSACGGAFCSGGYVVRKDALAAYCRKNAAPNLETDEGDLERSDSEPFSEPLQGIKMQ